MQAPVSKETNESTDCPTMRTAAVTLLGFQELKPQRRNSLVIVSPFRLWTAVPTPHFPGFIGYQSSFLRHFAGWQTDLSISAQAGKKEYAK